MTSFEGIKAEIAGGEYSGYVVDGVLTTVPMGLHYTEVDNAESTENTYEDGTAT